MIQKFRAWDENQQIMRGVRGLFWTKNNLVAHCSPMGDKIDNFFTTILNDGEYRLMQSTGLFDKNGVEIFEGDVVIAWSQGVKGTFEIKRRIDGLCYYIQRGKMRNLVQPEIFVKLLKSSETYIKTKNCWRWSDETTIRRRFTIFKRRLSSHYEHCHELCQPVCFRHGRLGFGA